MAHKGKNEFGGDRTGPSYLTEEAPLPPPPRKPKKKKKKEEFKGLTDTEMEEVVRKSRSERYKRRSSARANKGRTPTNKRGGGMVGSNKIIKGYKKGGQV